MTDLPIGDAVPGWEGSTLPPSSGMAGRYCAIEPLDAALHLEDLYEAFAEDVDGRLWTYMSVGPFESKAAFSAWLDVADSTDDPLFHALIDQSTGRACGLAAYMRIKPDMGVIEIGSISYAPRLARTRAATEAMFLFMQRAFEELGYRRYEWKCDSLNAASRTAAERLGFSYEGIFRQAMVYKGRNRDTAWYAILDSEWPALKAAYLGWLDPSNFDGDGQQLKSLRDFIGR